MTSPLTSQPESAKPCVSAVIPSYAEGDELIQLYEQVRVAGFSEALIIDATPAGPGRAVAERLQGRATAAGGICRVLLDAPRGRASQMNHGAQALTRDTDVLVFIHADTRLSDSFVADIQAVVDAGKHWGRFSVCLDASGWVYRLIEFMMNFRSRFTGMCTGDQCLFIRRDLFEKAGGFPEQPLMEDIEISKSLRHETGLPGIPASRVSTSARRWQLDGPWRTIVLMWRLRFLYAIGTPPETLAKIYANTRRTP